MPVFISWKKQVKMVVFISRLVLLEICVCRYNISVTWDLFELIKRRSKVQEKNMSCKRGLNFNQWQTPSKNYKPMRFWLQFVYKFTENHSPLPLFSEFICHCTFIASWAYGKFESIFLLDCLLAALLIFFYHSVNVN